MKLELVTKQLVDFGLSDKEASIYITLLTMGKAKAGEIARKLQLNRMLVYRIVTKLRERELVKASMEKPMKFVPIPLETALNLLVKETEGKLSLMKERYTVLIEDWNSVDVNPAAADTLSFRIVQGRKQIYALLTKMFKSSQKWVKLITTSKDLVRFQYVDLDDTLKKAAKRGVKVEIAVQYEGEKYDIIGRYINFAEVKLVPMSRATRLFIIDDRELVIAFTSDDSMALNTKQDTCLHIQSSEGKSLETMVDIFANIWESADDLDVQDSISKSLEDLKIFRDEETFMKTLKSMLEKAESEILIGIPKDAPPAMKDKVIEEAAKKADQLYVRLIIYVDHADLPKRRQLSEKMDVYHTDVLQSMQFIIKDRKEILITLYLNESEDHKRCKHIWSNSRLYLDSVTGLLMDVWRRSVEFESRANELKKYEMSANCLSELKSILERSNWRVQMPGQITPRPGVCIEFDLLAEDKRGRRMAAEFIVGGDEHNLEEITSFYGKAMNSEVNSLFLISIPPPNPKETSLAQYYNIHLLEAERREDLTSKLAVIQSLVGK